MSQKKSSPCLRSTLIFCFFLNKLFIMVTMLFFPRTCLPTSEQDFFFSARKEKSPFRLRCAVHFCLLCANVCTCFGKNITHFLSHPLLEVSAPLSFLLNKKKAYPNLPFPICHIQTVSLSVDCSLKRFSSCSSRLLCKTISFWVNRNQFTSIDPCRTCQCLAKGRDDKVKLIKLRVSLVG